MKSPLSQIGKGLILFGIILYLIGCLFANEQAPQPPQAPPIQWGVYLLPENVEKYEPTKVTQAISVLVGYGDVIDQVPISRLEAKWHQSGGMLGIEGVKSDKYRYLPSPAKTTIGNIAVWNGSNFQDNRGIKRTYPDNTRFDDVLSYKGKVFEHRTRTKEKGKWISTVIYDDESARPPQYKGLTITCAECHKEAGSGGYAVGLVPGGDTVLSDPLDWSLLRR